jgi:hypothetical protein
MITKERERQILKEVEPEIIDQEPVQDGTDTNHRSRVLEYTTEECKIIQTRLYDFPASHRSWKQYKCHNQIIML